MAWTKTRWPHHVSQSLSGVLAKGVGLQLYGTRRSLNCCLNRTQRSQNPTAAAGMRLEVGVAELYPLHIQVWGGLSPTGCQRASGHGRSWQANAHTQKRDTPRDGFRRVARRRLRHRGRRHRGTRPCTPQADPASQGGCSGHTSPNTEAPVVCANVRSSFVPIAGC